MEAQAPTSSFSQHTETRLSFDSFASPIVSIQLPSTSTFARTSRTIHKVLKALPTSKTDDEYRHRRVATSSGTLYRSRRHYPRSLIWRCLEANKVVEVRSLDISKQNSEKRDNEADLVLRFSFPGRIAKDGIALVDTADEETVSLFVLTTSNELYTITLKSIFFCKSSASEDDFDRWVRIFKPASLSISSAFRFKAINSREIFIGLNDGRLLRLVREAGGDGSKWAETAYSDGQWGSSLRGLIRWSGGSNTVTYDGITLDHNAALGMALSPTRSHLLSVGINHTLKFWNLETGRANISKDLLNQQREPQEIPQVLLHPSTRQVLETFECQSGIGGDLYYAVTFSPHESGVFKFWGIRDEDNPEFGIRDLFEDDKLRVPEPDDGALWTMVDYKIHTVTQSSTVDIWILMRLNQRYKIYRREFSDLQSLGREWIEGWSMIKLDAGKFEPSNEPPSKSSDADAKSISERWLDYLTTPGRCTESALETALMTFNESTGLHQQKIGKGTLEDRLASQIGSSIYLPRTNTETGIDNFNDQLQNEWNSFWKVASDLDQAFWEPLNLSFDHIEATPYTIFSNGFSIVRELSELETLAYNSPVDLCKNQDLTPAQSIEIDGSAVASNSSDHLAAVVDAAARFRTSFSATLKAATRYALQNELWKDASMAVPERIQAFYDVCDFEGEIGDRVYNHMAASLKAYGGLRALRTDVFLGIFGVLPNEQPSQAEERSNQTYGTLVGQKLLCQATMDSLAVQERVMTDLLYLLVFHKVESDEDEIEGQLDANTIYVKLLNNLRQIQMIQWLSTRIVQTSASNSKSVGGASEATVCTVLERDFIQRWPFRAADSQSQSAVLIQTVRDLQNWASGDKHIPFDDVLVNIQATFLRRKEIDLASSFAQFQPSNAWSTYIKGRLYLEREEYVQAAQYFKKAALGLGMVVSSENGICSPSTATPAIRPEVTYVERSGELISKEEQVLLHSGFPNYYSHIIDLLSTHEAHAQILYFAELAVQHCTGEEVSQYSKLLDRLFHASMAIGEYPTAYAALARYTDHGIQRSAISELITRMISNGYISEFLSLPLTTLKKDVEKILAEKAEKEVGFPVSATPSTPYFKILYAFHVKHKNFRAAAGILVSRLEARHTRRKSNAKSHRFLNSKLEVEKSLDEYLVGINALALLAPEDDDSDQEDEAWVFVEDKSKTSSRRKVMRIEDLRERYEGEMDRVSAIELGKYGIIDEDDDDDDQMDGVEGTGTLVSV